MKTYIINLAQSIERRGYMNGLLSKYDFLDTEFVEAVDGRRLNADENAELFDTKRFYRRRGYQIRPGEIGCTLSHRKCYQKLLDSKNSCCLILEDDIETPKSHFTKNNIKELGLYIDNNKPTIILLSDWYWFSSVENRYPDFKITRVFDAFLTHAYIINRKAAELLLCHPPCYVADEWIYIRKLGVNISAVSPHMIHQKWDGSMPTVIQSASKPYGSSLLRIIVFVKNCPQRITHSVLKFTGRFYRPYKGRVD